MWPKIAWMAIGFIAGLYVDTKLREAYLMKLNNEADKLKTVMSEFVTDKMQQGKVVWGPKVEKALRDVTKAFEERGIK